MIARRALLPVSLLVALSGAATGQAAPVAAQPRGEIVVSLITFGSGELIFERFGHNALRFQDARTGEDVAYHWGLFSFSEPGFLTRFLTGETNYWMGAVDARALLESETNRGRHATVQTLRFTPEQAMTLREFVRWNALEENKFYRYDYYVDNCSTRLRDALDRALGGALERAKDTVPTSLTYRRESVRVTDDPARAGIDIALGKPADAMLSEWESYFIPMRLRDGLRNMRVTTATGIEEPLVADEQVLALPAGKVARVEAESSPRLAWRYLLVGLVVAGVVVALAIMTMQRPRGAAAWGLATVGSVWSLLGGVMGIVLLLAWSATKHQFWAWNDNVLLLTPLSLALVALIPLSVLRGVNRRAARMVASLVVILGLIALIRAVIPGGQENRAIVALILPVHVALSWALALIQVRSPDPRRA